MFQIKDGIYSHRFSGNAMDALGNPHCLVGIGYMKIVKAGKKLVIAGLQQTSLLRLKGSGGEAMAAQFLLDGVVDQPAGEVLFYADITFTQTGTPAPSDPQVMQDRFAMTPAGGADHFWLISTKPKLISGPGVTAAEAVWGEAVRMDDALAAEFTLR